MAASRQKVSRKGCPNHPIEFKCRLAAAACDPTMSVAKLALEHGINANMLFKWRRQYRKGEFGGTPTALTAPTATKRIAGACASEVKLLPVQVSGAEAVPVVSEMASIEVVFGSATVRIIGTPEASALRTVLEVLARRA